MVGNYPYLLSLPQEIFASVQIWSVQHRFKMLQHSQQPESEPTCGIRNLLNPAECPSTLVAYRPVRALKRCSRNRWFDHWFYIPQRSGVHRGVCPTNELCQGYHAHQANRDWVADTEVHESDLNLGWTDNYDLQRVRAAFQYHICSQGGGLLVDLTTLNISKTEYFN